MIYSQPMLSPSPASLDPIHDVLADIKYFQLDSYLKVAQSGLHIYNPYHNMTHELLVCYHALTAYFHKYAGDGQSSWYDGGREIALAALFHDHNHSGGKHKDVDNVQRAILKVSSLTSLDSNTKSILVAMISTTEFTDGRFPYEPKTFKEECLRDADLCSIYTTRGQLILMELPREFGAKAAYRMGKEGRIEFLKKNKEFLQNAKMYTEYGNMMKEFHLDRACEDFEDLISRATMANHTPSYSNWNA